MELKRYFDSRFLQGVIDVYTFEKIQKIPMILFTYPGFFDRNFANFAKIC